MENKISIKDYLENKELLEINYIPYEERVEICNVILDQCTSVFEDYNTLNSVLLERVKTEIFISYITNLDFSIKDENGLDGYDQLCFMDELDDLIYTCGYLYEQFEDILALMINDYYHNIASTRGYLNTLKTSILNWFAILKRDANEYINSIDLKAIADKIIDTINKNKNKIL